MNKILILYSYAYGLYLHLCISLHHRVSSDSTAHLPCIKPHTYLAEQEELSPYLLEIELEGV